MRKLLGLGKKRVLVILAIVLIVGAGGFLVWNQTRDKSQSPTVTASLAKALEGNQVLSSPDDAYIAKIKDFISKTDDVKEKGGAYIRLADAYSQKGMYKESLGAFKEAREIQDVAKLSDEDKTKIKKRIASLEYIVEANENPKQSGPSFKEPSE
jgi:hypothetical protein